jgi:PRTRC genetic system protein C
MTLIATPIKRVFRYNSVELPDPGAQFTVEQVRDIYAATYPEITSAAVEGPEEDGDTVTYTFRRAVGTKGATKQAELMSPVSCLNKAESSEPLFVLRAHDPIAAQTVRHWATMAEGTHESGKIAEARALANEMERWHTHNVPTLAREEAPVLTAHIPLVAKA